MNAKRLLSQTLLPLAVGLCVWQLRAFVCSPTARKHLRPRGPQGDDEDGSGLGKITCEYKEKANQSSQIK